MPEVTKETPRETYTIAGKSHAIAQPYHTEHKLTPGEVSQLNQVYAENVRNNLATKVKSEEEAGTYDAEAFQAFVDDYCESYEMGVRTGGGRSGDPVQAEALNIARDLVRKAIRTKGLKLADVPAAKITALAKAAIEKNPHILETARQRVEAAKEIAGIELGSLDTDDAEAPVEAHVSKRAKAA